MNRRRPQAAAIFDLDRTLISGASGPAFSHHLAAAGVQRRSVPGTDAVAAAFRVLGETAITAPTARLAARAAAGWPVEAVAAAARPPPRSWPSSPAVRAGRHRRAPRGRPGPGDGDHQPGAARHPVRRAARLRRRRGHRVGGRRRHVHRRHRRTAGVGARQARGRRGVGHRRTTSTSPTRTPTATASTTSRCSTPSATRPPSTPTCAWPSSPTCGAGTCATSTCPTGVLKIAGRELQQWPRPLQRPELLANVDIDLEGIERIPQDRPGHRRVQPPQLLRRQPSSAPCSAQTGRSFRFLGKKEVFDAPVIGYLSKMAGGIRVDRGIGLRRAARAGHPRACRPARPSPSRRRARSPAARRSSSPSCAAAGGRPAWPQATGAPVHPDRAVGHRGRVAAQPPAAPARPRRAPDDPGARRRRRCRCKHRSLDADTKRIMAALVDLLPPEARVAAHADRRRARRHLPARLQGRPARRGRPPPRHRHLSRHERPTWPTRSAARARPASSGSSAGCPTPRR